MEAAMSAEAVEVRRNYQGEYQRENQAQINAKRREWRADNKEKYDSTTVHTGSTRQEKQRTLGHHWQG